MKPLILVILFMIHGLSIYSSALTNKIDSLEKVLKTIPDDTVKINVMNSLCIKYKEAGNFDKSITVGETALRLNKKLRYLRGEAKINISLGICYWKAGQYNKAIEKNIRVVYLVPKDSNEVEFWAKMLSNAYNNLAINYHEQSNFPKAMEMYMKVMTIREKLLKKDSTDLNVEILATVYNNISDLYDYINQPEMHFRYALKASKLFENYIHGHSVTNSTKMAWAGNFGTLGNYYDENQQDSLAFVMYLQALALDIETDFLEGISVRNTNIGNLYIEAYKMDSLHKGLEVPVDIKNRLFKHVAYKNLLDSAEAAFSRSSVIDFETNDKYSNTYSLAGLGEVFFCKNQFESAIKNYHQSYQISEELGTLSQMQAMASRIYESYKKINNHAKALEWYERSAILKDTIFNQQKTREITINEMNYEFSKQQDSLKVVQLEKESVAKAELQKEKIIRNSVAGGSAVVIISAFISFMFYKRRRDALQNQKETALNLEISEVEMKALRSQMNPHFIFNALQSIQTFLMQNQPKAANEYLIKFSKLMRAVLENSQHREIPLEKDMEALELYMQLESLRLKHPFTYEFHIDETLNIEEALIPPLILQPFVENAIWHGLQHKEQPGHIDIYLAQKDDMLFATVKDNGVGRKNSSKVNHSPFVKKESLGMKLTEERLKVINETKKTNSYFKITDLYSDDEAPSGTEVELSLPLAA
jgi:tetratricopeptide (TPR) repeat protein